MLELDAPFRDYAVFYRSFVKSKANFFFPDPGSQNVADPLDSDPKHCLVSIYYVYIYVYMLHFFWVPNVSSHCTDALSKFFAKGEFKCENITTTFHFKLFRR